MMGILMPAWRSGLAVLLGTLLSRIIIWGIEEVERRRIERLPRVGEHFRE
ncbi:MAG: hypothetical protein SOY67_08105 [Collinsella sp.]|nr:hypothetical protein [Collinsella sp.]